MVRHGVALYFSCLTTHCQCLQNKGQACCEPCLGSVVISWDRGSGDRKEISSQGVDRSWSKCDGSGPTDLGAKVVGVSSKAWHWPGSGDGACDPPTGTESNPEVKTGKVGSSLRKEEAPMHQNGQGARTFAMKVPDPFESGARKSVPAEKAQHVGSMDEPSHREDSHHRRTVGRRGGTQEDSDGEGTSPVSRSGVHQRPRKWRSSLPPCRKGPWLEEATTASRP